MPLQCPSRPLQWPVSGGKEVPRGVDGLVGTSLYWLPSGLTRLMVACRIGAK